MSPCRHCAVLGRSWDGSWCRSPGCQPCWAAGVSSSCERWTQAVWAQKTPLDHDRDHRLYHQQCVGLPEVPSAISQPTWLPAVSSNVCITRHKRGMAVAAPVLLKKILLPLSQDARRCGGGGGGGGGSGGVPGTDGRAILRCGRARRHLSDICGREEGADKKERCQTRAGPAAGPAPWPCAVQQPAHTRASPGGAHTAALGL